MEGQRRTTDSRMRRKTKEKKQRKSCRRQLQVVGRKRKFSNLSDEQFLARHVASTLETAISDGQKNQTWLFATHESRFQKPGDYRTYELAGFSFIVILGTDKRLRAFHNVCRHRAYAVTKKECGSSTVLGCRYHGWSYDSRGKLIKAPEFEGVPGFDKEQNGLWELKTEIRAGMVFVNFDARSDVESVSLGGSEDALKRWDTGSMRYVASWKTEAPVNWKSFGTYTLLWKGEKG